MLLSTPDVGYPDGNTVERDNGLFGSQAGRDKRPLVIKLKKARQCTSYDKHPEVSKKSTKGCDLSEIHEPPIH